MDLPHLKIFVTNAPRCKRGGVQMVNHFFYPSFATRGKQPIVCNDQVSPSKGKEAFSTPRFQGKTKIANHFFLFILHTPRTQTPSFQMRVRSKFFRCFFQLIEFVGASYFYPHRHGEAIALLHPVNRLQIQPQFWNRHFDHSGGGPCN